MFGLFLLTSCDKEDIQTEEPSDNRYSVVPKDFSYHLDDYEIQDQVKIAVGEALNNISTANQLSDIGIIENIVDNNTQDTKEMLYIRDKNIVLKGRERLEDALLDEF